MTHITYEDVVAELPAIIATRGEDFVYRIHSDGDHHNTCTYIHNGEPDCIIGCYLVSRGVPVDAFEQHEGSGVDTLFGYGWLDEWVTATPEAIALMGNIQDNQDMHYPWGEAYTKAVENIEEDEF